MSVMGITTDTPTARATALAFEGARDMTPMVVGVVPFGFAIGATIAASSVDTAAGLASAPAILAGSAQLATVQMLDAATNPVIIVVSALLINLRIILYSTSLAPWFAGEPLWRRLVLAVPVIDQTHFVCQPRFERGDLDQRGRVAYYTGAATWLVAAWLASQAAAVLLGAGLPASARLDMAAPLALVGLLAKSVGTRPAAVAGAAAIGVAAIGAGLPLHSATLVATLAGIAAGVTAEAGARGVVS
jgi:predicted branched-subunit amino acid permease